MRGVPRCVWNIYRDEHSVALSNSPLDIVFDFTEIQSHDSFSEIQSLSNQLKEKSNDEKEQNLDVLSEKVSEDDLSLPSSTFLSLSFPNTDEKNNLLLVSNELNNNNNNDFNNVVRTRAYSYSDQELELEEKGEIDAVKDSENVEINNIDKNFINSNGKKKEKEIFYDLPAFQPVYSIVERESKEQFTPDSYYDQFQNEKQYFL